MFSMAPNIVLAPNMTQNAERKHRTQDANTAPIRPHLSSRCGHKEGDTFCSGNPGCTTVFSEPRNQCY